VVALSGTTLLLWVGASAILPLLPSYLRAKGSSPALVGVIMSAFYAASVVTQYPIGRLADRVGVKTVIAGGLVLFAGGSVGFALLSAPGAAVGFRALQGVGAGAVTVASAAAIGALVAPGERGGAFGALYGSQMLALAVGPLVGSVVGQTSMRVLFLAASALALAALFPLLGALRAGLAGSGLAGSGLAGSGLAGSGLAGSGLVGSGLVEASVGGSEGGLGLGRMGQVGLGRALFGVVLVFGATGLLAGVYETCWTLLLRLRHATSLEVGLSWTLFALPFALLSVPAGRLAERSNRRLLALGALASSAAFCALYPTLHVVGLLVGLGVVEATGAVVGGPPAVLILAESVPPGSQGAAQGVVETARTAATAVAAAASGALFGISPELPFALAAALVVGACLLVWWAWRNLPGRAWPSDGSTTGPASPAPLLVASETGAGAPESPARGHRGGQ